MSLDLTLPGLCHSRVPAASLLGLAEFFFSLPAFGRLGTLFEIVQKVPQAGLQCPPCAVPVGVRMLVPAFGGRTEFEASVELLVVLGDTRPGIALLLADLLSGRLVWHLGRLLCDRERERVSADDDDHLVFGLAAMEVGPGFHLVAAAFRLGQERVHDPQGTVGLLP